MNSTNWFNHDASSAYQDDLYRAAENERLADEAQGRSSIIRAAKSAISTLNGQSRKAQPQLSVRQPAAKPA